MEFPPAQAVEAGRLIGPPGGPKATIYSWVRRRDIPFVKLAGVVRFDPEEINNWLMERNTPAGIKFLEKFPDPDVLRG